MNHEFTESDRKRAQQIRYYRRRMGLTQAELAKKIGVSETAAGSWEKGVKPSLKHWHALCQVLPIPPKLLDADLTDPVTNRKMQMALLRRLPLSPDDLETLDKAIALYYEENEPLPEPTGNGHWQ